MKEKGSFEQQPGQGAKTGAEMMFFNRAQFSSMALIRERDGAGKSTLSSGRFGERFHGDVSSMSFGVACGG